MPKTFDLATTIAAAEAGDVSQWEAVARHLLAKQPKPKKPRKSTGPQTWAHVCLMDGREYLTSAYAKADTEKTMTAHGETAQYRARMEDSGDNGTVRRREFSGHQGVTLNPNVKPVSVKLVTLLDNAEDVERLRARCFEQRGKRQGWWDAYQSQQHAA